MHRVLALLFVICLPLLAVEPHYEVAPDWPQLPEGDVLGLCAGVGVDAQNRVFVFHRRERNWIHSDNPPPIVGTTVSVLDGATGKLLNSWGANFFILPHGLSVDGEGNIWLTDIGLQQVFKFTPDGKLLLTLGERGKAGKDHAHFNRPTDVAVAADGSFYVSDGYLNTRVIKFSATGQYEFEWGGEGNGPGEFILPHGLALDAGGRVYVCDRGNARLQIFDPKGKFLDQWKGDQLGRPYAVALDAAGHVFVVDGGETSGRLKQRGKVVELDAGGKVMETFGSYGKGPGQFLVGHDLAVGPDGAVYVAEAEGKRVQKFVKK